MNSKDAINRKIYYLEARNTLDTNVVTIKYWLGSIDIFEDCLKSDFPGIIGLSFLKGFLVSLINARIMKDLEANEMEEEITSIKNNLIKFLKIIEADEEKYEYSNEELIEIYENLTNKTGKSK